MFKIDGSFRKCIREPILSGVERRASTGTSRCMPYVWSVEQNPFSFVANHGQETNFNGVITVLCLPKAVMANRTKYLRAYVYRFSASAIVTGATVKFTRFAQCRFMYVCLVMPWEGMCGICIKMHCFPMDERGHVWKEHKTSETLKIVRARVIARLACAFVCF